MTDLVAEAISVGSKPALIVVDVIRGFTDPECPLGHSCEEAVAANQAVLAEFRARKLPVFFTTVVYHNEKQASVFRKKLPALDVLQAGSKWVEIDPALERQLHEPIIEKQWASGFFATDLAAQLALVGADSLVVTGLTTSGCVRATAVDGLQNNYPVIVAADATSDRNREAHEANLFDLQAKYAEVATVKEIISLLDASQ